MKILQVNCNCKLNACLPLSRDGFACELDSGERASHFTGSSTPDLHPNKPFGGVNSSGMAL
jgi:hypothetical protein